MKEKLTLKLIKECESKLQFVKTIKDCTNYGLKECKVDICDKLHRGETVEIEIKQDKNEDYHAKLLRDLPLCGGEILVRGGSEFYREVKLLELGLGSEEDYQNFLIEHINNLQLNKEDFLKIVFQKLNKTELVELFEVAKESYYK